MCQKLEAHAIADDALRRELAELGKLGDIESVGVLRALEDRFELEDKFKTQAEFKKQKFVPNCILKMNRFIAGRQAR